MLSVGSLLRVGFGNWQLAWDGVLGFGSQLEMPDGIRQSAGDAGRARSGSRKMDVPVSRGAQAPRSEPGDHAACRAEGAPPRSSQNPRPMTALSAVKPGGVQRTATQPRRLPTSTKTQPRRPRTRTCTNDAHGHGERRRGRAPAPTTRTTRPLPVNPRSPPPHLPCPHDLRRSSHASLRLSRPPIARPPRGRHSVTRA
jgi:hypothetical protein